MSNKTSSRSAFKRFEREFSTQLMASISATDNAFLPKIIVISNKSSYKRQKWFPKQIAGCNDVEVVVSTISPSRQLSTDERSLLAVSK